VQDVRRSSQNANKQSPPMLCASGYKSPLQNPRSLAGGFVKTEAFAKINLFLDVVGKRDDGFHDIVSVMLAVDLCDELIFEKCDKNGEIFFSSNVDDENFPTDEKNLVVKAAGILMREFDIREGIKINLTKRIPIGAGLAGGSSDCAATLLGINELFGLNIPFAKLLQIGKSLGADVPFCLTGGMALTEGIGEKITPLPPHPQCHIVIACPQIHVSTAEIFSQIGAMKNESHEKILSAIYEKNLYEISSSFYNIFTPITSNLHPEISILISELKKLGALNAEMSGTGSSVYAFFEDGKIAETALNKIKKYTEKVFLVRPWGAVGNAPKN
jgi:4-diphosphocytidyl-2-C-methyl-D-erythritol kinase